MIVHIKDDIFIKSTGLGYDIARKTQRNVKDKETKEVTQEDYYDPEKHYTTLTGAINGLQDHYVQKLPDSIIFELNELIKLIGEHKKFIESKLGGF